MSIRPVAHFTWQVLRTVKRSRTSPTGRHLRLVPTRRTKDGTFLNALVDEGLLTRVTGSAGAPFEATYALTERGEHAAEYGEYDHAPLRPAESEGSPPSTPAPKSRPRPKAGKRAK